MSVFFFMSMFVFIFKLNLFLNLHSHSHSHSHVHSHFPSHSLPTFHMSLTFSNQLEFFVLMLIFIHYSSTTSFHIIYSHTASSCCLQLWSVSLELLENSLNGSGLHHVTLDLQLASHKHLLPVGLTIC